MIEPDRTHHRNIRIHEIHRIQPPTQPDFQDRHIDATIRENHQRRERIEFEKREGSGPASGLDALKRS